MPIKLKPAGGQEATPEGVVPAGKAATHAVHGSSSVGVAPSRAPLPPWANFTPKLGGRIDGWSEDETKAEVLALIRVLQRLPLCAAVVSEAIKERSEPFALPLFERHWDGRLCPVAKPPMLDSSDPEAMAGAVAQVLVNAQGMGPLTTIGDALATLTGRDWPRPLMPAELPPDDLFDRLKRRLDLEAALFGITAAEADFGTSGLEPRTGYAVLAVRERDGFEKIVEIGGPGDAPPLTVSIEDLSRLFREIHILETS